VHGDIPVTEKRNQDKDRTQQRNPPDGSAAADFGRYPLFQILIINP
jgi:hypothetical protein